MRSMLIDLSVKVTKETHKATFENEKMASFGHLGTHFDVMNKTFPLAFTKRKGVVFDVSKGDRDIDVTDVNMDLIQSDMFVAFYTGFIDREGYGTKTYFKVHPQLSKNLIDYLLNLNISMIGIDCAGIRRGGEHTPTDQYCADKGVFVIENLSNLERVLNDRKTAYFTAHTYPIHFEGMTGLPCRVVAEVE